MSNGKNLYRVMQELGFNYMLGITTWPNICSQFDSSIESKWICGIPCGDEDGDVDYMRHAYGETPLMAAKNALKIKVELND